MQLLLILTQAIEPITILMAITLGGYMANNLLLTNTNRDGTVRVVPVNTKKGKPKPPANNVMIISGMGKKK